MVSKTGFDLFTTTGWVVEDLRLLPHVRCCLVCTSPFSGLCKPICKWRKATLTEFLNDKLKEGVEK
jgi:hypothetical protein